MRFHDLRHSAASFLIAQGVPVPTVSAILGHASASVTLNVYSHTLKGMDLDALERVQSLLRDMG